MDNYEHLDKAWEELTPEEKKQISNMEPKTGLGHQYKADEKAFLACRQSLYTAYNDLTDIVNIEANLLRMEIQKLSNRCFELAHSAFEKSKLNQD